ncbi:hypothetical protein V6R21_24080 [Limibacter armeniacum]|uniref:hypothetical protein n=1 Tax=Limibacter armeniacum TaxID=466084 RepID=UPI002FE510E4
MRFIITFLLFLMVACGVSEVKDTTVNVENLTPYVDSLQEVNRVLLQEYTVPVTQPSVVIGKMGLKIKVEPEKLETVDGSPLGETIEVQIKELLTKQDMFYENAPTVSEGRLLVSDGAYLINMLSDGKQLKVKEGNSLLVNIPSKAKESMDLFFGDTAISGQVNWVHAIDMQIESDSVTPDKAIFERITKDNPLYYALKAEVNVLDPDTLSEQVIETDAYRVTDGINGYYYLDLSKFGWINCDRFYEDTRPKTNISVSFDMTERQHVMFVLFFENINSVMRYLYLGKGGKRADIFSGIPVGEKVHLIAYTSRGYAYHKKLEVEKGHNEKMKLKLMSKDELTNLINTL